MLSVRSGICSRSSQRMGFSTGPAPPVLLPLPALPPSYPRTLFPTASLLPGERDKLWVAHDGPLDDAGLI